MSLDLVEEDYFGLQFMDKNQDDYLEHQMKHKTDGGVTWLKENYD